MKAHKKEKYKKKKEKNEKLRKKRYSEEEVIINEDDIYPRDWWGLPSPHSTPLCCVHDKWGFSYEDNFCLSYHPLFFLYLHNFPPFFSYCMIRPRK